MVSFKVLRQSGFISVAVEILNSTIRTTQYQKLTWIWPNNELLTDLEAGSEYSIRKRKFAPSQNMCTIYIHFIERVKVKIMWATERIENHRTTARSLYQRRSSAYFRAEQYLCYCLHATQQQITGKWKLSVPDRRIRSLIIYSMPDQSRILRRIHGRRTKAVHWYNFSFIQ